MADNPTKRVHEKKTERIEGEMPEEVKKVLDIIAISKNKHNRTRYDLAHPGEIIYHKL